MYPTTRQDMINDPTIVKGYDQAADEGKLDGMTNEQIVDYLTDQHDLAQRAEDDITSIKATIASEEELDNDN